MTNTSSLENDTRFNTGENDFMMAFAVENTSAGGYRSDTNYVRWMVVFKERIDGILSDTVKELHRCTDLDMEKFYPPENPATIENLQSGGHLFCLD